MTTAPSDNTENVKSQMQGDKKGNSTFMTSSKKLLCFYCHSIKSKYHQKKVLPFLTTGDAVIPKILGLSFNL